LASDAKNIKESLNHVEAVWNLIFSVYQLSWDSLYADNNSATLRQKVMSKFTPKLKPTINRNNVNKQKLVPASIEKLFPSIPTKLPKKVNQISKFFKKKLKLAPVNKSRDKSYAQASKPPNHTEEVIKIKDTFPSLSTSKINQVQKIIKGKSKPKPYIQMTTKDLSRNQLMNGDNCYKLKTLELVKRMNLVLG